MNNVVTALIDQQVLDIYEDVVRICNKILANSQLGIQVIKNSNPNPATVVVIFDSVIIPALDGLSASGALSPESDMKLDNIRQYSSHIREISRAIVLQDQGLFDKAVDRLHNEAMIFGL